MIADFFMERKSGKASDYFRLSSGLDYSFSGKTYGFIEYHFNSGGAGQPFVGRAGSYLDKIFHSHSLERKSVYITSVLKCYHPGSPKKDQIKSCLAWTEKQIEVLQPELILIMGRTAEQGLFDKIHEEKKDNSVEWGDIPCIITCHPAAAMRFPERDKQFLSLIHI